MPVRSELVATTKPDVLLLDLTLPEGDALPLLEFTPRDPTGAAGDHPDHAQ